jgi:glyoxylase-like metal-dependent hydrolase (beta-lactamase superfamily II)
VEDRPQEIVPGLYRLRTPMTSKALPWAMPYALCGPDGVSLFDSGYGTPEAIESMESQLEAIGYEPAQIRRLIVSHSHPDHLGMAGWVKEQAPDCELVMHEREAQWHHEMRHGPEDFLRRTSEWLMRHGVSRDEALDAFRREGHRHGSSNGRSEADGDGNGSDVASETERRSWSMPDVAPDLPLRDGDVLDFDGWRLLAVWTPGHTPGHLCVYEANHRLMLTGDHVLSRITPNVSLSDEDERAGRSPLAEFLDSLAKVASFETRLALPAHEELIEDLPGRCTEIARHHDHRLEEVLEGVGAVRATASDVSTRVTWNKPYETFNVFKKRSALGETLAHLQLLLDRGSVRRTEEAGIVYWERV